MNYIKFYADVTNGFAIYNDFENNKLHDAGYDSIITGRCFVLMCKAFENNFETENKKPVIHLINRQEKSGRMAIFPLQQNPLHRMQTISVPVHDGGPPLTQLPDDFLQGHQAEVLVGQDGPPVRVLHLVDDLADFDQLFPETGGVRLHIRDDELNVADGVLHGR